MKNTAHRAASAAAVSGGLALALTTVPTVALAEESAVGADILIPKVAEFVPALIVQSDLDAAERSKVEAAEQARAYDEKIVEAHREAEAIVAKAKKEAEEERSRILAKAQKEAVDIIAKAHGAVDSERHKAMIELSGSVVDLSVEIASKIIGNDLTDEQQRRLAEKYLAEVGTSNGN